MKATIVLAAFAAIALATPASAAANLVKGGDFESGQFAQWMQFGDTSATAVYRKNQPIGGRDYPVAHGKYAAAFGPFSGLGGITQTIDTTPGVTYDVSFDLANFGKDGINQFMFSFNDGFQISASSLPKFRFQNIVIPVTATGLTADVSFFFYNPSSYFLLDDVSVIRANTPTAALAFIPAGGPAAPAVPEPTSWSMLLAGFAAIGVALRRRPSARTA